MDSCLVKSVMILWFVLSSSWHHCLGLEEADTMRISCNSLVYRFEASETPLWVGGIAS